MSDRRLIANSLLLFIDQIAVSAAGGWFYWLLLSKLTSPSVIGEAIAVYSLINLVAALSTLGLEYSLLKRSHNQRSEILGTALLIELAITIASVPIVIYILSAVYTEGLDIVILAILILVTWAFLLATRFAILGVSNARTILIIDTFATGLKLISACILIYFDFRSIGILSSILLFNIASAATGLYVCIRVHGFKLSRVRNVLVLIKEGLVNMPSIISRSLIYTLTIVLLAAVGMDDSEVGTFYMVLMISLFAGGLVTSSAYMLLPFSSTSGADLSLGSTRLALSLTVPIIAALISSPKFLLSLIGPEYIHGQSALMLLSIGIIPFSIVTIGISKFNYLGEVRKLTAIGTIQVTSFVIPFLLFTATYGMVGAAISVLMSYILSALPCMVWSDRMLMRYVLNSIIAVTVGGGIGYAVNSSQLNSILAMAIAVMISLSLLITLKNTSITEIRSLILSFSSGAKRIGKDRTKN
jgi:O-antigen/teichoic acid export membrane protein